MHLERFRPYMDLMARVHLRPALRTKVSPSDVVQDTLAEAYLHPDRFEGRDIPEQIALLRRMLASRLARVGRDLGRQKRDIDRERSLEAAMMDSSTRFAVCLVADGPSPSDKAMENEQILMLADALRALPEDQQEAILLHYMEGLSSRDIGERLGRSPASVCGLLRRGLGSLRRLVGENG
jgi:RNA polymerase sigma-70 factor (ECF subfamily)